MIVWVAAITGTPVRNEMPRLQPDGSWELAHTPVAGASCYRNGLRQAPTVDYTLTGRVITSPFWHSGDVIVCDYEWAEDVRAEHGDAKTDEATE
jgi:hypothetical protein